MFFSLTVRKFKFSIKQARADDLLNVQIEFIKLVNLWKGFGRHECMWPDVTLYLEIHKIAFAKM